MFSPTLRATFLSSLPRLGGGVRVVQEQWKLTGFPQSTSLCCNIVLQDDKGEGVSLAPAQGALHLPTVQF